ncbi:SubName: Full=Uncharacterized protein {ECO:0000313/EMBL:CCA75648.1} [Serendipita indica DSM 11827]|nr:SubName: Full=Uncharacterized protein {ECO:0000313/EMBL:CCA75648.1} [Serendipita indica DSM 11827]
MKSNRLLYDVASGLKPQASSPALGEQDIFSTINACPTRLSTSPIPTLMPMDSSRLSPMDQGPNRPKTFLPVISVPSEDGGPPSVIADSINIAIFLDAEYPDTPRVLPPNTRALQIAFAKRSTLDPRGAEYYKSTREKWFNIQLDEYYPRSPEAFQAQPRYTEFST